MNSRERLIAACTCNTVDRPPVWLMRQAGRYLPEYREIRSQHSFWEMVRSPKLAAEITLQPLRRFAMDAAILFSDILVVPAAMGVDVHYQEGGPVLSPPIRTLADIERLKPVVADDAFDYVREAVELLCRQLHPDVGVIGFAGAPLTLAAYMVEGGASRDLKGLKTLAYREPQLIHQLLAKLADAVTDLLLLQIKAGADVVQIFDTWAGYLSPDDYQDLALPYTTRIVGRLAAQRVPVICYLRNAAGHLELAASSGCQVLSVDCSLRLSQARNRLGPKIALQGNLDPIELFSPPERIADRVRELIRQTGGKGHVMNLGQGLSPDIPVEGVGAFVNAVKEFNR